jgi:type IX secretion system substrate protein
VGAYAGLSWLISTADLAGTPDPLNDPSVVATYTIQNPAPNTSFRIYINNATGILTPGSVYYWTPVVFGNATAVTTPPTFLSDLLLDITCTYTGTSLPVYIAAQGDPACTVGINENTTVNGDLGISNLYPVPVRDKVTFTLNSKEHSMVTISLKDNLGKEVLSQQLKTIAGENTVSLDLSKQSAGVYFITASSDAGTVVSKFVKE